MTSNAPSNPSAEAAPTPRHPEFDQAELAFLATAGEHPDDAQRLYSLGCLHVQRGNAARAIEHFEAALALAPAHTDCLNERAIAALMLRDHEGAIRWFERAVRCAPDKPRLHCNLGNAMRDAGREEDAVQHFDRALALDPGLVEAAIARAEVLDELGRAHDALAAYRHLEGIEPGNLRVLLGLGRTLNALQLHGEAETTFQRGAQLQPGNTEALFGVAVSRGNQFRFEEALEVYRRIVELAPQSSALQNNIGFMLTCLGRYDEADDHFRQALRFEPDLAIAKKMLGMSELRRGHFREGWMLYEARKSGGAAHGYFEYDMPEWRGESLDGKRILLVREQGAGDELQFIRYADVLRALGATVDIWTRPELEPLMSRAAGIHRALTQRPQNGYDYYCPVMSVPLHLHDEAIPGTTPYLSADAALIPHWRERIARAAGARRKIGLVWAGNPSHHLDRFRSMPLQTLAPLAHIEGLAWFSLQKGAPESQLDACAPDWPIHRLGPELENFEATAAAIESLDLVISVDTSVAHLAGALGRPVWVMLPAQADWRWMTARDDNLWYPTARLFRQRTLGDWSPVVDALCAALKAL